MISQVDTIVETLDTTDESKRKLLTFSCTLPYIAHTYTQLVLEQVASSECQLVLLAALAADALPFVHVY